AYDRVWLQKEATRYRETLYWADPNLFDLLPLRVVSGDPRTALSRPDGLVITPEAARKYFGTEHALGATLLLNDVPMKVAAIVEPPPAHRSMLESGLFASARAAHSPISQSERDPNGKLGEPSARPVARTLFRLPPGTTLERFHNELGVV